MSPHLQHGRQSSGSAQRYPKILPAISKLIEAIGIDPAWPSRQSPVWSVFFFCRKHHWGVTYRSLIWYELSSPSWEHLVDSVGKSREVTDFRGVIPWWSRMSSTNVFDTYLLLLWYAYTRLRKNQPERFGAYEKYGDRTSPNNPGGRRIPGTKVPKLTR